MRVTLSAGDRKNSELGRRHFLGGVCVVAGSLAAGVSTVGARWGSVAAAAPAEPQAAPLPPAPPHVYSAAFGRDWAAFRQRTITPDGRVVDTGNGGVSHSEGQGWGLMAAQAANDPQTFARLLAWTTQTLQCRGSDSLHAWRFRPGAPEPVADLNNATDGDLFIAAALARAAARWNREDYAAQASRIARDILGLVRVAGGRTVLLPGAAGFEKADSFVVNPSYYAFGLFPDLAAVAPSPHWAALQQDGRDMLLQARFGRWMLPPDWLRVDRRDGALGIAPGWPARFSYDAIRIPLHLVWGNVAADPVLQSFRAYWTAARPAPPAWTDLRTGEEAPYPAAAGLRAVASLTASAPIGSIPNTLPSVMTASDYYSAGLILLSRMAAEEGAARAKREQA